MKAGIQRDFVKLSDIQRNMRMIAKFTDALDFKSFVKDEKTCYAVERALAIIGDAVKLLSPSLTAQYPDIPWKEIARMRDKIIHHYDYMDYKKIWEVIQELIPGYLPAIDRIIQTLDETLSSSHE